MSGVAPKAGWRRWVKGLVALGLMLAVIGYLYYWYWPKERPGLPESASGPAELLVSGSFEVVLWLPFPHQNLAEAARSTPQLAEVVSAASRLAGGEGRTRWPAFGPFTAPPARELAVAFDLQGGRAAAVARVYPAIAVLAKLAGKLAGNPWLSGGAVESGGRRFEVSWEGSLWRVRTQEASETATPGATVSTSLKALGPAPTLALVRIARPLRGLPVGLYALDRQSQGFLLSNRSGWRSPVNPSLEASEAAAVAYQAAPDGDRLGVLFDSRLSLVPRLASLFEPGKRRWKLPTEKLLELAGRDLPKGRLEGWGIVAGDEQAYDRAAALAPRLAPLRGGTLALGLWLRPASARGVLLELANNLKKIPVFGDEPSRKFRDMALVLEAVERFERVEAVAGRSEGQLRLEFDTPSSIP